ncbi:unnamed protein product [Prunus armeniaca]
MHSSGRVARRLVSWRRLVWDCEAGLVTDNLDFRRCSTIRVGSAAQDLPFGNCRDAFLKGVGFARLVRAGRVSEASAGVGLHELGLWSVSTVVAW